VSVFALSPPDIEGSLFFSDSLQFIFKPTNETTLGFRFSAFSPPSNWYLFHQPVLAPTCHCRLLLDTQQQTLFSFARHAGEGLLNFTLVIRSGVEPLSFQYPWFQWLGVYYALDDPINRIEFFYSKHQWRINEIVLPWPFQAGLFLELYIKDSYQLSPTAIAGDCCLLRLPAIRPSPVIVPWTELVSLLVPIQWWPTLDNLTTQTLSLQVDLLDEYNSIRAGEAFLLPG
jgi:hypothetical protein